MHKTKDLAWVGGLLEGEASFMIRKGCPKIALQMTDLDTVQRVAAILGVPVGAYSRQPKGKATYLPVWHLAVHGTRAISWMMTLYQFFGARRQEKIRSVISAWTASNRAPRASRGTRLMAICHPDKPRTANLLCNTCWMRGWRERNPRPSRARMKAEAV